MPYRRHWLALALVLAGSFAVLGGYAPRIRSSAPPIPVRVVGPTGAPLFDGDTILRGQGVWQAMGGQEVGSVWGHGAYVAPDWTADWLHREATFVLDRWARAEGAGSWAALGKERQAALRERLELTMRRNTLDPATGTLRLGPERAAAFEANAKHYADLFSSGSDPYAIQAGAVEDPARARDLAAFFWWTSWAASTLRPGDDVTYTQNWPHEPLVGNRPTGGAVVWSVISFHHLYFAGTPASVTALGAAFSALEVVPLTLVGLEVWHNIRLARATTWLSAYRWPIYFFVSVAFWNLVGAGLFGFFINPPIALYYMQGLNTTPVHGHTALFGVYGMLGIGLMLFCLRALRPGAAWRTAPVAVAFWLINAGLALMVLLSLLPIGILQTWASVETGTWWARSAEFMQEPVIHELRWLRVPGDTIFAAGALVLGWFVLGLATGWSLEKTGRHVDAGSTEEEGATEPGRA